MGVKRREHWTRAWRMVMVQRPLPPRRQNDWTLKIVVACCVALFFLSPGFSRMLPVDSKACLGRSVVLERSVMTHEVARSSEMRGRILVEAPEIEGGRGGVEDDLTSDYSTPTHNRNADDENPSPPGSKATSRSRTSQQFSRYTAQYGHRHLRGV